LLPKPKWEISGKLPGFFPLNKINYNDVNNFCDDKKFIIYHGRSLPAQPLLHAAGLFFIRKTEN
jgi:hypothetical protein